MATKIRRSRAEWREFLASYERSGLSQQTFCEQHGLALSTFCKWRRDLGSAASTVPAPVFAELEVSSSPEAPVDPPADHLGWDIELALGDGVVLRIRSRC